MTSLRSFPCIRPVVSFLSNLFRADDGAVHLEEDDINIPGSYCSSFNDGYSSSSVKSLPISVAVPEAAADALHTQVETIMDVISSYLNKDSPDDQFETIGRHGLRNTVVRYVETGEQMELIFPAFPFKSCSSKKVLGELPDLGEEILLRRLNALAHEICDHHAAGAVIRIVSDGVVYQGEFHTAL
jgi:hypothetical protein